MINQFSDNVFSRVFLTGITLNHHHWLTMYMHSVMAIQPVLTLEGPPRTNPGVKSNDDRPGSGLKLEKDDLFDCELWG